jgi:hypothetical protein
VDAPRGLRVLALPAPASRGLHNSPICLRQSAPSDSMPTARIRRSRASTGRGLDGRSATGCAGSRRDVRRGPIDDSAMASAARKRASVAGGRREKYREDTRVARVDVDDLGTACRFAGGG